MKQIRDTAQRKIVRDIVGKNNLHLTADEVYEKARAACPTISRGTVYRNLKILSEQGEIKRLSMPVGADHYDCILEGHYHFVCRECHRVLDANIDYDEQLSNATAEQDGCKVEWHRVILVGLCPNCNKNQP